MEFIDQFFMADLIKGLTYVKQYDICHTHTAEFVLVVGRGRVVRLYGSTVAALVSHRHNFLVCIYNYHT